MIQMHEVPPIVQLKDVFPAPRCMLMIMVKSSASDAQFLSFSTASGVQFNLTVAVISVFLHLLHLCVCVFFLLTVMFGRLTGLLRVSGMSEHISSGFYTCIIHLF